MCFDDGLAIRYLPLTGKPILSNRTGQVVHVVEVGAVGGAQVGVEYPRHADIDEEKGSLPAFAQDGPDVIGRDGPSLAVGSPHHDIAFGQGRHPILPWNRLAADGMGQFLGPVKRPVGYQHGAGTLLGQVTHADLTHLAGAYDEHGGPIQGGPKDFLRHIDRHAAHRGRTLTQLGTGSDNFRRVESLLENPVEHRSGQVRLVGGMVGVLHLADHFGFTQDHRIKTACDPEQVANGILAPVEIEMLANLIVDRPQGREKPGFAIVLVLGYGIDLDPVAGGKQDHFGEPPTDLQATSRRLESGFLDRELFAYLDGSSTIAQPNQNQGHVVSFRLVSHGVR